MAKLLFFVLSDVSAGELTIAYEFASRLPTAEHQVHFVVPERYSTYLEDRHVNYLGLQPSADPGYNRARIDALVKEFRPDCLIVSDAFTLEFASSWSGLRFAHLKAYQLPVVGVDEYDYLSAGYSLDYYGGLVQRLPPLVERCDYIIRNCPLNRIDSNDPRVRSYSLYPARLELSPGAREEVRRRLGVGEGEKIVFYTTSPWETLNMHKVYALDRLIEWIPRMLQHYLTDLGKPLTVIHVGPNPWEGFQRETVRYRHFPRLTPTDFDQYLLASDLFITLNVVSVTLSKAVYGTVPSLVLQNHKLIDFEQLQGRVGQMPPWYQAMAADIKVAYPFRAGTMGWHRFLEAVMTDNPYTGTYAEASLFKPADVLAKLHQYLYDEDAIGLLQARQMDYIGQVLRLPTPGQIMREVLLDVAR
jgi:hypothetical protein